MSREIFKILLIFIIFIISIVNSDDYYRIKKQSRSFHAENFNCLGESVQQIIDYYKHIDKEDVTHLFTQAHEKNRKGAALICAEFINDGYFDVARDFISCVNQKRFTAAVMNELIVSEKGVELFEFIDSYDTIEDRNFIYSIFYEQMKKINKLNDPLMIEFFYQFKRLLTRNVNMMISAPRDKIENYANDRHSIVDDAVKTLVAKKYSEIIDFRNKFHYAFKSIIPKFIKFAYDCETANLYKIERLIESFTRGSTRTYLINSLYSEMKACRHIDTLQMMQFLKFIKDLGYDRSTISQLPETLKNLFFSRVIIIESILRPDFTLYMSAFGNAYVYPSNNYEGGTNQKYSVEIDDIYAVNFRFKCVENSKVIYSIDDKIYGADAENNDGKQWWRVISRHEGREVFFKNKETGRVINVGDFESCSTSRTERCSKQRGDDTNDISAKHLFKINK